MSNKPMIDYNDMDVVARQNIAPNATCDIDGEVYDIRNLVFLARTQADRIKELEVNLERAWRAFAVQSRKLQAVLDIEGVREVLNELKW